MKKIITILTLLAVTSAMLCFSSCAPHNDSGGKIKVIATLFPQYDFARQVAGDRADVSLLLAPGTESHTYDPSAHDIYNINNCDVFLYTGENMEAWAGTVISGISNPDVQIIDVSSGIQLVKADDDDEEEEEEGHVHTYDPHFWLNPIYAVQMLDNVLHSLCEADPDNAEYYRENAEIYKKELYNLDSEFEEMIKNSSGDTLVFGGRFAYIYFIERYSLEYRTAYNSCSTETEPSLAKIYEIINYIDENGIPCIFREELSEAKVANSIAEQTDVRCLQFSTAHNLTKEEFESGKTFIDIMRENLENVRFALNY